MSRFLAPAVALVLSAFLVLLGGRMLAGPAVEQPETDYFAAEDLPPDDLFADETTGPASAADSDAEPLEEALQPTRSETAAPREPSPDSGNVLQAQGDEQMPTAASRMVEPEYVAPPELPGQHLEREPAREPLSQLSLALPPPPPEIRNDWSGKPLFRPLAIESAVFQSGDLVISLSGVRSLPPDESCTFEGREWGCGIRARAAFRAWLRGRALVCQMPDEEREVTRARCRLAKQDAGAWLVSHGWAFAEPDGPYVQAEEKARAAKMGIFAGPPDTSALSDVPDAPVGTGQEMQPIMTEEGIDPQPSAELGGAFPPAPPPPLP